MKFAFTDDQKLFRDTVREALTRECTPAHVRAAWDPDAPRPTRELWARLAEMGVIGASAPESNGGLGMNALDLVLLFEEAGYAAFPEPFLETTALAIPLLADVGGPVASSWLPKLAAGRARATVGLEDAPFVSFADDVDVLLLAREGALHAVPRDAVMVEPERSVDGARRPSRVRWDVIDGTLVAEGELAAKAVAKTTARGAVATAAELLGLARRMLEMTVEYAKVRKQFGKPIGTFQAVQHRLADALIRIEMARPVVYRGAYALAHETPRAAVHVSMAKIYASEAATFVAKQALQCHGAIGYSFEHDLHLFMKRAWALAHAYGDATTHRQTVAAALLDVSGPADRWDPDAA